MASTTPAPTPVRIGLIGAGGIYDSRHLPNLRKLGPEVDLVAIANRSHESSAKVAKKWGIPHVEHDWKTLVRRDDLDAVMIGTWPYMHAEMSIAALAAGKHVFCQARMAATLDEARAMLDAARAHPHLVNMLCPPPTRMPMEPIIRRLLADGTLGDLAAVSLTAIGDSNLKSDELHWRENIAYSGRQILAVGIYAETLNAILGPFESLSARFGQVITTKKDHLGHPTPVHIPQSVAITGCLPGGAVVSELHTGAAAGPASDRLAILGTRASLYYPIMSGSVFLAHHDGRQEEIKPAPGEPATVADAWQVERQFITAVQAAREGVPAAERPLSPDFAEGLAYMVKMEAIHRSATSGRSVTLAEVG